MVGVNRFSSPSEPLEVFAVDPRAEATQVRSLAGIRAQRDRSAARDALEALRVAAAEGENVVPATVRAVQAYATVGEIVDVLRSVHGGWIPTATF